MDTEDHITVTAVGEAWLYSSAGVDRIVFSEGAKPFHGCQGQACSSLASNVINLPFLVALHHSDIVSAVQMLRASEAALLQGPEDPVSCIVSHKSILLSW